MMACHSQTEAENTLNLISQWLGRIYLKLSGGDNQAKTIAIEDFLTLELIIKSTRNYNEDILKMAINRL